MSTEQSLQDIFHTKIINKFIFWANYRSTKAISERIGILSGKKQNNRQNLNDALSQTLMKLVNKELPRTTDINVSDVRK